MSFEEYIVGADANSIKFKDIKGCSLYLGEKSRQEAGRTCSYQFPKDDSNDNWAAAAAADVTSKCFSRRQLFRGYSVILELVLWVIYLGLIIQQSSSCPITVLCFGDRFISILVFTLG